MNNSKWQINKVGLVDFWYYDQEEFEFLDGRMLLRGSNGSGKSVTMQSFIPLLLDGNMRPERLDPFGSRARKMENYLLGEEEEDREERTGYLYMEFKRKETENYLTIGIGMRARKNKKMEVWYFTITDGRRVGKDFLLYKDVQSKITYTKTELRNRIGDGGQVFDTQNEYMNCVNKLIFGFETIEEYKEMLELLIQLRTPKLSKDFKPTVINDILSNSLQPLSEDDLRPMSEAIENMDNIKTNLENLEESVKAAREIGRVYDKYNQKVLYDKALYFKKATEKAEKLETEIKNNTKLQKEKEVEWEEKKKQYEALKNEQDVLEQEKISLADNDATRLKEQEQKTEKEIAEIEKEIQEKKNQEEKKRDQQREEEEHVKNQQGQNEMNWKEIEDRFQEMEECLEEIPFDEGKFLGEEIKKEPEKPYHFQSSKQLLENYMEKVEAGIEILEKEASIKRNYDSVIKELDEKKSYRNQVEREYNQYEQLLQEVKMELTEKIYAWEKNNGELHLEAEQLQKIARMVEQYEYGFDYSNIYEIVQEQKNKLEDLLRERERNILNTLKPLELEEEQLQKERKKWEEMKDPQPEREIVIEKNREELARRGISYLPFYQTIDFAENISEDLAGRIEEALEQMGLLDAIIVSPEYKDDILAMENGMCDKYIFEDVAHIEKSLLEVMEVDNPNQDILLYQKISNILMGVGYGKIMEKTQQTWIDEQGNFQLGILSGTVTKEKKARYIGTTARARYRTQKIEELLQKLQTLGEEIKFEQENLQKEKQRLEQLNQERNTFPKDKDIATAAKGVYGKEDELSRARQAVEVVQGQLRKEEQNLKEIRIEVQQVCEKTYLSIRLDVFQKAKVDLRTYEKLFYEVQQFHDKYVNGVRMLQYHQDNLEVLEEDLDVIRYEWNQAKRKLKTKEEHLTSIREQLKLTDYEKIKERLEYCIHRLQNIPEERDLCTKEVTKLEDFLSNCKENSEHLEQSLHMAEREKQQAKSIFWKEANLNYVGREEDVKEEEYVKQIIVTLQEIGEGKIQEELHGDVQEVFHKNKGALAEFQIQVFNLFEDWKRELEQQGNYVEYGRIVRLDIKGKYRGMAVSFKELIEQIEQDVEEQKKLLSLKDRELFEDILANTISKKIRRKIQESKIWVKEMNQLMEAMRTSSGLKLSLKWKSKRAEKEEQLDTQVLAELLEQDSEIMKYEDVERMSQHFRSKIEEARKEADENKSFQSFHVIMKEILDYRKWFEFQLECQKTGEKKKELTDRVFFTFSGGEKAMAMYVPLFSAVVAKYSGARKDAPRLISLDEAFAGVDEMNIKDMFRLMVEFEFNFMINSQVLWGDYETVPSLAIFQLIRPENANFVTVIHYIWNGKERILH